MSRMKTQNILISFLILLYGGLALAQPGSFDKSFSSDGVVYGSLYEGFSTGGNYVLIQQDGKVLSSGGTNLPDGTRAGLLIRLLPDGGDDLEFNQSSKVLLRIPGEN